MKITLKQIAREAGVSQATVSRLVNQNTGVSSELEEKVTNAAKKLGVELPRKSSAVKSDQTKNKV
ncbi:MAG TPA: LacI family DNA-binding transcriptional regulator, partial [Flexilinea sp.]|nr:LacI family DNA-binding transcriptional regulator [Flexilinea sp.]